MVGEELEGDDFEDGEEGSGAAGTSRTCSTSWWMCLSPSVAMAMTHPLRAVTSWMLERVFSYLRTEAGSAGSFGGDDDDPGRVSVNKSVGAVLHLAGWVAFGVDVGDPLLI